MGWCDVERSGSVGRALGLGSKGCLLETPRSLCCVLELDTLSAA